MSFLSSNTIHACYDFFWHDVLQFLVNTRLLLAEDCFNLYHKIEALARSRMVFFLGFTRKIIVYSWSTINVYSLISHEWWVSLIIFMVRLTIYVRWGVCTYGTLRVPNNFLFHTSLAKIFPCCTNWFVLFLSHLSQSYQTVFIFCLLKV